MEVIETTFKINKDSKLSKLLSGRVFRSDKEFFKVLQESGYFENQEDFLFGTLLKESDKGDYVKEEEVFNVLEENIGK